MRVRKFSQQVLLLLGLSPATSLFAQKSTVQCPPADLRQLQAPAECGVQCGVDRWGIKTLSDRYRGRVRLPAVQTTITALAGVPAPSRRPPRTRVAPQETTIYCLDAYVISWDEKEDRDIHLTLLDPIDQRTTLIAEIPDPGCAGSCSSGYAGLYADARRRFYEGLQRATTDTVRVRIMGVGFFDKNHGQSSAAPNLIELHPVLAISFP